jgi:hypothetical protein
VTEAGGGGRWELCSEELVARPEQQAKGGAIGDPRAGRSNTRWRCKRPEGGARRGHHWRRQWRLGVWAMRVAASLIPFIGARALWRGSRPSTVMGAARRWRGATTNGSPGVARRGYDDAAACGVGTRGGTGEGRKGRFGANGSHRARTDGHWPVSTCGPGGTTAARAAWRALASRVPTHFHLTLFD